MEQKSIEEGAARVKFSARRIDTVDKFINRCPAIKATYDNAVRELADALWEMEGAGAAPVLPDGKVGGNAAVRLQIDGEEVFIVSKSGKIAGQRLNTVTDICIVRSFDAKLWSAEYYAIDDSVLPTSDTPMHHASLNAHRQYDWAVAPNVVLHGHALATEEDAARLGLPISSEETLCSTPEDTEALMKLFADTPYPDNRIFVRKGHGFLLLASTITEAVQVFRTVIKPNM